MRIEWRRGRRPAKMSSDRHGHCLFVQACNRIASDVLLTIGIHDHNALDERRQSRSLGSSVRVPGEWPSSPRGFMRPATQ